MYRTRDEFRYDITKIFDNARTYNQEETIYYKYANLLQSFVRPMLDRLKEASLVCDDHPRRGRAGLSQDVEMIMPGDEEGQIKKNRTSK